MRSSDTDRKIAVIFAADVVGYSKHMEKDEDATLASLNECNKIIEPIIKKQKGRIFNTGGDSVCAEFPSAVAAINMAVEFQKKSIRFSVLYDITLIAQLIKITILFSRRNLSA